MSGSGPEEPRPSQKSEEDQQQEAEQDWAAAKAFYDNLVTHRPRPVSAGGPGVRSSGVRGEAGGPGAQGRGPALPCARSAAQAPECHHGRRVLPSTLQSGRGAAHLRRSGRGEVRGVPAEKREHHPQARTGVLLRQGLTIERFCMTGGQSPIGYLTAYLTNLYLSADSDKVQEAIEAGIASATMFTANKDVVYSDTQLRVAFDGDAVIFSDESEQIFKEQGLDRFFEHEQLNENKPLAQGPLKGFLEDLGKLQKKFYAKNERLNCPIRTYLVTARSAASSGARVLKTLRSWGLEIDEALFLAGAPKGPILVKIRPHIFFDDQMFHIEGAQKLGAIAAHVPYGIAQKHQKPA
uniref:5'-nucleotidase, cytosolic IB n=1 Tax=Serinus canaria TaxID=9135 RepID=A0A8C9NJA4_SERCA